jgi:hypothetical protein
MSDTPHIDPATTATAPAANASILKKGASHAAEQAFLKIRKPVAKWIAKNIPDPLRDWAKTWSNALPYVSILIATLSPDTGIWRQIDSFQQDLFDAIEEELETPSTEPATTVSVETTAHLNTLASVMQAVDELATADRQDFEEWFFGSPDHQVGFNRLVAGADKDKIKSMAVRSKPALERMIKPFTPMTFAQLRAAIASDAVLTFKVNSFLGSINTASGQDRSAEFWKAVEGQTLRTLQEFADLMVRSDAEILSFLHMPSETIKQRLDKASAAIDQTLGRGTTPTGAVKWSSDFLARAKKAAGI